MALRVSPIATGSTKRASAQAVAAGSMFCWNQPHPCFSVTEWTLFQLVGLSCGLQIPFASFSSSKEIGFGWTQPTRHLSGHGDAFALCVENGRSSDIKNNFCCTWMIFWGQLGAMHCLASLQERYQRPHIFQTKELHEGTAVSLQ